MTESEVRAALDDLSRLKAELEEANQEALEESAAATADMDYATRTILSALHEAQSPWRIRLNEIEARRLEAIARLQPIIEQVEKTIETGALKNAHTVKGSFLQAVYYAGRVTWDSKGLDGFAVTYPKIKRFRKVGRPYIVIRPVIGGDSE